MSETKTHADMLCVPTAKQYQSPITTNEHLWRTAW